MKASNGTSDTTSNATSNGASKIRLDLAYTGTNFRGFTENTGVRTVEGELRSALECLLGVPVELAVAGRTDAGVHATAQVVTVSFPSKNGDKSSKEVNSGANSENSSKNTTTSGIADLTVKLNKMLAPEITVAKASVVPDSFDARHSARSRMYRYLIYNSPSCNPLQAHRQWHLIEPLDVQAMNCAAEKFVGQHDFSSFCRQTDPPISLVRKVLHAHWNKTPAGDGSLLEFEITAWAFCHQMVRSLVWLCVAVGQARRRADEVPEILAAKNRNAVGQTAPPHGLTLIDVGY